MTRHTLATGLVLPTALALLTAACGGSSNQTLRPGAQPTTHQISDKDSDSTVHARVGDDIVVTLHSTYWQLTSPSGGVLVAVGSPRTQAGGPSCSTTVPGSGCGWIRADYRVAKAGNTHLEANRSSCGEAMRCQGSQGRWSVGVVATG